MLTSRYILLTYIINLIYTILILHRLVNIQILQSQMYKSCICCWVDKYFFLWYFSSSLRALALLLRNNCQHFYNKFTFDQLLKMY